MAENQNVKNRLLEFIKYKGIKKSHFEKQCGLSNGYLNAMVNTISYEKLEGILKVYPELNAEWLMNGVGTMIKVDATAQSFHEASDKESNEVEELKRKLAEAQRKLNEQDETIKTQANTIKTQADMMQMMLAGNKICG